MTLAALNECNRDGFVSALGWVFEESPWVAERAWARKPFGSLDELHAAMTEEVAAAGPAQQLALLRAHPDLGSRIRMSDASNAEQSGAGLDRLAPSELERLRQLNDAYREKFGFPFLLAVRGMTEHGVLEAIETRLSSTSEQELAEALRQVCLIARFRLQDAVR